MFTSILHSAFQNAHQTYQGTDMPDLFNEDDRAFLDTVFQHSPETVKNFTQAAEEMPLMRALIAQNTTLPTIRQSHWVQFGIPEDHIQTVNDHVATCVCVATIGMEYRKGFFRQAAGYLPDMLAIHALSETLVSKLNLNAMKEVNDKDRLQMLAMAFLASGTPRQQDALDLWQEFKAQETATAKYAHDIDKLEVLMQAQVYENQYPELADRLQTLWTDTKPLLKTEGGRSFYDQMEENRPNIHPLKTNLPVRKTFDWRKDPNLAL